MYKRQVWTGEQTNAINLASEMLTDPDTEPRDRLKALVLLTFWNEGEWGTDRIKRIINEIDAPRDDGFLPCRIPTTEE